MSKVSTLLYFYVLSTSRKESYCHIKPKKAKKKLLTLFRRNEPRYLDVPIYVL